MLWMRIAWFSRLYSEGLSTVNIQSGIHRSALLNVNRCTSNTISAIDILNEESKIRGKQRREK